MPAYSVVLGRSTERRPSPNYRIYSNAFQGGRVSGDGAPFNYSNSKVKSAVMHVPLQLCMCLCTCACAFAVVHVLLQWCTCFCSGACAFTVCMCFCICAWTCMQMLSMCAWTCMQMLSMCALINACMPSVMSHVSSPSVAYVQSCCRLPMRHP